jgi:hypothetical protein
MPSRFGMFKHDNIRGKNARMHEFTCMRLADKGLMRSRGTVTCSPASRKIGDFDSDEISRLEARHHNLLLVWSSHTCTQTLN